MDVYIGVKMDVYIGVKKMNKFKRDEAYMRSYYQSLELADDDEDDFVAGQKFAIDVLFGNAAVFRIPVNFKKDDI